MIVADCARCRGTGQRLDQPCTRCGGVGQVMRSRDEQSAHVHLAVRTAEHVLALEGLRSGLAIVLSMGGHRPEVRERLTALYEAATIAQPPRDVTALLRRIHTPADRPPGCPLTAAQLRAVREVARYGSVSAAVRATGANRSSMQETLARACRTMRVTSTADLIEAARRHGWLTTH